MPPPTITETFDIESLHAAPECRPHEWKAEAHTTCPTTDKA